MKQFLAAVLAAVFILGCAPMAQSLEFPDVEPGSWYYTEVTEMTQQEYLKGCDDGRFHPERTITNAEYVTIVARLAGLSPKAGETSHWAAGTLAAALDKGWYDWDEIPPTGESFDSPITRQVAVKIMMKALAPKAQGEWEISESIADFASIDGRYYSWVLAAYDAGIIKGDEKGNFNPKSGLLRAEASVIVWRALALLGLDPAEPTPSPEPSEPIVISGGVSENGRLSVIGTQLCNERGEPVVLRGMSTHGMQWYGDYASSGAMKTLTEHGANLIRIAIYTDENGYISNPTTIKDKVIKAVDAAIANDMYVIIDWHILHDNDPNTYKAQAKEFFAEMAERYAGSPAVIYEICNEPNGNVSWEQNIRPYAMELVPVIREKSPDSVIIVGTATWSQDVDKVAANPLPQENLMYAFHFYAGTHGKSYRDKVDAALKAGTPVFVSEWGTSAADGSGGVYLDAASEWIEFMAQRGLSWANWSLCDKNESSAALKPGASVNGSWIESNLSESGRFVFGKFK